MHTMTTTLIGIDISKYSFELCGTDARGKHTLHKRLHRDKMLLFFANFPRCTVALESCSGSQYWARQLTALGHTVMLIPAQHVVAFRQGAKNDRNDAAAIAEAARRPHLRTVPVKTLDQQDLQTIHRIRERLVHHRRGTDQRTARLVVRVRRGLRQRRQPLSHLAARTVRRFTRCTVTAGAGNFSRLARRIT